MKLHSIIKRDLIVEEEAVVLIYGTIEGTLVNNDGQVVVKALLARSTVATGQNPRTLLSGAVVRARQLQASG
ncbi:hypothetical protein CWR43_29920 [Rhizobium sullae]|uniref:Uncharacterized protein n=1 Tax=Rhizobium sullae TaxID=50338 RepID=A0A2N0D1H0_RHISU|nr:hypothetical protein [Rhizobium sullae]PKA39898.1 hypothetical protein CWR43_29920 [Rhizobium sullae]